LKPVIRLDLCYYTLPTAVDMKRRVFLAVSIRRYTSMRMLGWKLELTLTVIFIIIIIILFAHND